MGPGKYDKVCTLAAKLAGINGGGGVVLIVIDGDQGSGFSVQADPTVTRMLPLLLRKMADELATDIEGL